MQKISLKIKFLIPLVILILIIVVSLNYAYTYFDTVDDKEEASAKVMAFKYLLQHHLLDEGKVLFLLLDQISSDKQLKNAFISNDREKLYTLSKEYYNNYESKYDVTHMYFIKLDKECFLRTHFEDRYGDTIKRESLEKSIENSNIILETEVGTMGSLTYRCVMPWVVDNNIIGYLELGIEYSELMKPLEVALNSEILVGYNEKMLNMNKIDNYHLGQYISNADTNYVLLKESRAIDNNILFKELNKQKVATNQNFISNFVVSKGDKYYNCILFEYSFSKSLSLPVYIIHEKKYTFKDFLKVIILSGSIIFGLIIFLIFLLITEKIEKKLDQRELELLESNTELENFAYAASHDLKAPLRAIDNLATWIEEDLEIINENTTHQLELMRGRIARMNKLLDGLLEYSRIGRVREEKMPVDVGKLLQNILYSVSQPKGFKIEIAPNMPILETYYSPLNQIFLNLIVNALKHHNKKDGTISITAESTGNFYRFSIKDNGPGIPKEYHEKIFQLFQTLESKDKVEGVGMGLAIIKKSVDQFGGEISLISEENHGSTFVFTWPKK